MDFFSLSSDKNFNILISFNFIVLLVFLVLILIVLIGIKIFKYFRKTYEINEAEIGIGIGKIKIKPNYEDTQIAYKLWVEMSTRKIGLPIDFENCLSPL